MPSNTFNEPLNDALTEAQKNLSEGRLEQAEQYFKVALKIDTDCKEAKDGLQEIKTRRIQHNLDEAKRSLNAGDFPSAKNYYQQVLDITTDNNEAIQGLIEITFRQNMERGREKFKGGDYRAAVQCFQKAVEAKPSETVAKLYRTIADGQMAIENKDFAGARQYFETALGINPSNDDAKAGRFRAYFENATKAEEAGQNAIAIELYRTIADEDTQARGRMEALQQKIRRKRITTIAVSAIVVILVLGTLWAVTKAYVNVPQSLCGVAQCTPTTTLTPTLTPTNTSTPTLTPTPTPMLGKISQKNVPYYQNPNDIRNENATALGTLEQGQSVYVCAGYGGDRYLISLNFCHISNPLGWVERNALSDTSFNYNMSNEFVTPGSPLSTYTPTPTPTLSPTPTATPTPTQFPVRVRYNNAGYFEDVNLQTYLGTFSKATELYICAGYSQDRFLISNAPCHENGTKGWVNKRFLDEVGLSQFSFNNYPPEKITPGPTLFPTSTPSATPSPRS